SAAHLSALRRVRCGTFDVAEATSFADNREREEPRLLSLRSAIAHLPTQQVGDEALRRVQHGNAIEAEGDAAVVALVDAEGDLVAIARREGSELRPRVVLRDA